MNINILLKKLKKAGYEYGYAGPEQAEIYAVQMLSGSSHIAEKEILYVSRGSDEDTCAGSFCRVCLDENGSADDVLAAVQRWLITDIKRKDYFVKLQKDISDECEIYDLVRHCWVIMQNPVLFVNHSLNVVCRYPEAGFDKACSVYAADRVEAWRNAHGKNCQDSRPRCQIQHIFYKNEGYYICVIEKDTGFPDICDMDYLQRICALFDKGIRKKGRDGKVQIQMILMGLLQKRFEYPEKEKKKLELLGWKQYDKYTVLAVERKTEPGEDHIYKDLCDILHTDIYNLGNYYAAILPTEKYVEYTEQDFPELRKYLEKNQIIGVLSMGFFDIDYCAVRFEQCKSCIEIVSKENHPGLRYYGRYQISDIMKILNKDSRIDLKNFCSPIILKIYEIDKKQKTDYLSTLFTYICSGQAMKYSADSMHIHVNTMYMRVSKLKDEFKINFDDAHMLYTLHNSIVFLFLCDKSCVKEGYPCLK